MATYNDDYISASELTAEARGAADAVTADDALSAFLPDQENDTLDYDLDAETLGLARAATFRSYDATAPFGRERSVGTKKGSLPAASIKLPLGELQQLRLRGASNDTIAAALVRKARVNGQSIAVRAILARGEAISTGKVTLNENEIVQTIDFGRPAGHTVIATTPWTSQTAKPLSEIRAWQTTYAAANGQRAQSATFSSDILTALATNPEVISVAVGRGSDLPSFITDDQVFATLRSVGIIDPIVYDKQVEDVGGTIRRVVAADLFVLGPARQGTLALDGGPLGSTQWGIPAESFQPSYGLSDGDQAGIFAGAFSHTDPEGMYVLASSIFLTVLRNAKATFAADVL
jgi:hypothetical protein